MRDYIVVGLILGAAPVCLFYPYFGVLMWSWIAYFNPHRFAWGFATTFPVALVIAIPTIVGAFFTRKGNRFVLTRETLLLLTFWAWTGITLLNAHFEPLFADHLTDAALRLTELSKIMIMTILTFYLVSSKNKLKYLLMLTAFSFGILALKGTIFGILTGGQFRVWGPPNRCFSFWPAKKKIVSSKYFFGSCFSAAPLLSCSPIREAHCLGWPRL